MEVRGVSLGERRYYAALCVALCGTALVQAWYLITHPFPALGGGLFLQMSATIVEHGGAIPPRVEGYTVDGIPFAYPPLAFYAIAALMQLGADGVSVIRLGTPLVLLGVVWSMYHLTLTLFDDYRTAAVAGLFTGVTVPLNVFLMDAGGFVRGLGFVFMTLALLGAYCLFAGSGGRRALAVAAAGWTLAVLTHPVHAAAAGIGVFAAWLVWDRSLRGLAAGAGIAVTGLALSSPWWLTVVSHHGIEVYLTGAGSHGSLNTPSDILEAGVTLWRILPSYGWPVVLMTAVGTLLVVGVGARLVARGNWHRPLWLLVPVAMLVPPHRRLGLLFLAPVCAVGLVELAVYVGTHADAVPTLPSRRFVTLGVLTVVLVPFVALNAAAVGGAGPAATLPTTVDAHDREAMAWLEAETPSDAGVAAIGGVAEWLPYLSGRTSVVAQYGTEWTGRDAWDRHRSTQAHLAGCRSASCVESTLSKRGFAPSVDYVWVPRGEFVSNRRSASVPPALHESLVASDRFDLTYENPGVVVYRYDPGSS